VQQTVRQPIAYNHGEVAMLPNILVVEDDPILCRVFCNALGDMGYYTQPAFTMSQALDYLSAFPYAAIVFDVRMMSETSHVRIRELARDGAKIILITGDTPYRAMNESVRENIFLVKSIEPKALIDVVRQQVPIRRSEVNRRAQIPSNLMVR
jgi:DNA-binding NtrC family response regulator